MATIFLNDPVTGNVFNFDSFVVASTLENNDNSFSYTLTFADSFALQYVSQATFSTPQAATAAFTSIAKKAILGDLLFSEVNLT